MDERCETCRFAKAYSMPEGECPPMPDPPKEKGFWRMLWEAPGLPYCNAEFFQALKHVAWKRAEHKAQTTVECQRFPEAPDKLKTDWCGEYRESRPGTGVKVEIDQARDDVVDLWNRMSERGN